MAMLVDDTRMTSLGPLFPHEPLDHKAGMAVIPCGFVSMDGVSIFGGTL
jgi:hypothetical protein